MHRLATEKYPEHNGHVYIGQDPRTGRPVTGLLLGLRHLPLKDWILPRLPESEDDPE